MHWALKRVSAPTVEPTSVEEAKAHLRIDTTDEDALISAYVTAAREYWEGVQGRALCLQTWDLVFDAWPTGDFIRLPRAPLRSVVAITYIDSAGATNTFAATDYVVDTASEPGRVVLGYGKSWPSAPLRPGGAITMRFRAGFAMPFSVNAATDVITATGHSYADGDLARVWNTGGSLPGGLMADTDYYARDISGDTLKLAATAGGAAIDLTSVGAGTHFLGEPPRTALQGLLLLVGHQYEHREPIVTGTIVNVLPFALKSLLNLDRVFYAGPGE